MICIRAHLVPLHTSSAVGCEPCRQAGLHLDCSCCAGTRTHTPHSCSDALPSSPALLLLRFPCSSRSGSWSQLLTRRATSIPGSNQRRCTPRTAGARAAPTAAASSARQLHPRNRSPCRAAATAAAAAPAPVRLSAQPLPRLQQSACCKHTRRQEGACTRQRPQPWPCGQPHTCWRNASAAPARTPG